MTMITSQTETAVLWGIGWVDMKEIFLSQGQKTTVSDEDFEFLSQWSWSAEKKVRSSYHAVRCPKFKKTDGTWTSRHIAMHNVIAERIFGAIPCDKVVDHINRNPLDNTRTNLRICSVHENSRNTGKQKGTSSKYKGVYFAKDRNKWHARLYCNKTLHQLGYFPNEKDAAKAYNKAAVLYFGEFAFLNVIED